MSFLRPPFALFLSFAIFLTTVVPTNVHAGSGSLDDIFDRFHYSMSVEWDQKDLAFKALAEKELSEALDASGVSTKELIEYTSTKILSGSQGAEFKRLMNAMKEQGLAPDSAAAIAAQFMKGTYAQGTHFMGEGGPHGNKWTVIIVAVVVVLVAHWLIKKGGKHDHDHHVHDDGDTVIVIVQ